MGILRKYHLQSLCGRVEYQGRDQSNSTGANRMTRFLLILTLCLLGILLPSSTQAQDTPPKQDVAEQVSRNPFRQALLKAADAAAKKGELRRLDVVRLRVATLSPAFLEQAETLAKIQMAASGEEVPIGEDGKIEIRDWSEFALFLERLLELILKLIDAFAFMPYNTDAYALS